MLQKILGCNGYIISYRTFKVYKNRTCNCCSCECTMTICCLILEKKLLAIKPFDVIACMASNILNIKFTLQAAHF